MSNISVALATFNGEKYLRAQLESLANQTARPSEIVVADDRSSDASVKIISEFAKKAPFEVRIIQNKQRLGYRLNFMQVAGACRCDLISFCDQDDIWQPDKLSLMQRAFDDPDALLAYHNANLIDEAGRIIGTLFRTRGPAKTYLPLTIHPWTPIPGHTQVMRRSLLRFSPLHPDSIDPYFTSESMPHDQWYPFWASVLGNIVFVPQRLAQYRQHEANASGWPHTGWLNYVTDHIANAAHYVAAESIGADNRLDLLQRLRESMQPDEIARVDAAISYYEAVSVRSKMRLAIYNGETLFNRAGALLALIKRGAYIGELSEAFGLPALLLDAAIGVPSKRVGR
jgi:rhamnosyltransferase